MEAPEPPVPIRVHLLARELGIASREILAWCEGESIEVKNHMSSLPGEVALRVRAHFAPPETPEPEAETAESEESPSPETGRKKRRRRRGGRRRGGGSGGAAETASMESAGDDEPAPRLDAAVDGSDEDAPKKKSRRSRRGGRRRRRGGVDDGTAETAEPVATPDGAESGSADDGVGAEPDAGQGQGRRRRKRSSETPEPAAARDDGAAEASGADEGADKKKRRKKKRRSTRDAANGAGDTAEPVLTVTIPADAATAPAPKKRRTLYASRRSISPATRDGSGSTE